MPRNPNIAVIQIGYNKYAFEDSAQALAIMSALSSAVQVDDSVYSLNKFDCPHSHFLADGDSLPKLEYVAAHKFNPHETVAEAKARYEREAKDREDLNQDMREAPAQLAAPAPPPAPVPAEEDEVIL